MMDCRQALQILQFDDLASGGLPSEIGSVEDRAAAEAHLDSCATCARTVQNRRELDRTIGQVMRAVPIPRGAQQRLLARIAELETADTAEGTGQSAGQLEAAELGTNGVLAIGENPPCNGHASPSAASTGSSVVPARSNRANGFASRRRFLKGLVPLAACLVLAMIGFFGVVWFLMPRLLSVGDVSEALAKIDFESLKKLSDFTDDAAAAHLPSDAGWVERLKWPCRSQARALQLDANVIAVYGFDVPKTRRSGAVRGLMAVIPRGHIRGLTVADSLATASPMEGYVPARIGDSICVAWRQGDFVCVCLLKGGADSLEALQNALGEPAA
jgi:hypothetical protein